MNRGIFMFYIGLLVLLIILALSFSGCGAIGDLRFTPSGDDPPPLERVLSVVAQVSEGGVGNVVQILAGFIGCGGLVAVGRKFLRDRLRRRESTEKDVALREIVAGVTEARHREGVDKETLNTILTAHQKTESTRRIVASMKVDNAKIPDKD